MMATATMLPYGLLALSPRLVAVVSPRGRLYRVTIDHGGRAVRCTCPGHVHAGYCKHLAMVERTLQGVGLALPDGQRLIAAPDTTQGEPAPDAPPAPSPEIRCPRCGRWTALLEVRLVGTDGLPRFVCDTCRVSSVGVGEGITVGTTRPFGGDMGC